MPKDMDLTIKVSFDAERFKAELYKRIALSSANDVEAVTAQMLNEVRDYLTIGDTDVLNAEFLEMLDLD